MAYGMPTNLSFEEANAQFVKRNKLLQNERALKSERLSKALTGVPHGPYVEPKDWRMVPLRPGEERTTPVIINGKLHKLYGVPALANNNKFITKENRGRPLRKGEASKYMQEYAAYKKAQEDYDAGVGPQWETYRKKYDDYLGKLNAYYHRIEKRDNSLAQRSAEEQMKTAQRSAHKQKKAELERAFHGRISPVAYAGLSPWNSQYGSFKKLNKKQMQSIGIDYNKVKKPQKKTIHLADGTTAQVIDSELGVPLGFGNQHGYKGASEVEVMPDGTSSYDYAVKAFDGKHKTYKWEGDCGHISGLEYSNYYKLLKVTFANGDIVIYYRIPDTVAFELLHFAETKQESTNTFDGSQRHVLGIRFWDLIRIRGTKDGSKYRFEYWNKNEGSGGPVGRPPSGEYFDVPKMQGRESEGYNIDELKQWMQDFEKEHGRRPTPNEYKDKTAELSSKRSTGDRHVYKPPLLGDIQTTRIKAGRDMGNITIDDLDSYFDERFNNDLAAKGVNRARLQQAYSEYNDMSKDIDPEQIGRMLRNAGASI